MQERLWAAPLGAALCLGCAFSAPIPEGPGELSAGARARLVREADQATRERTRLACASSRTADGSLRARRKCAELASDAMGRPRGTDAERKALDREVMAWAKPSLEAMERDPDVCTTLPEVARVYAGFGASSEAAARYVRGARECQSARMATQAARSLRAVERCSEAMPLAREAWPWTGEDNALQVDLMDAVTECSDTYSLAKHLAFVPEGPRRSYYVLLEQRATEARLREQRRNCEDHCVEGGSQCRSGCLSSWACRSLCSAYESTCRAGCG